MYRDAATCSRIESRPYRILVVDDNPTILRMARSHLARAGFIVDTAQDGQEALQHLQTAERPQLILLDLQMPGVDGAEFRRRQRMDPDLDKIPVILWSASFGLEDWAQELGCAGYIEKGSYRYLVDQLSGEIDRIL